MKTRNVAIAIFLDKDFNIIVQDRRGHSKVGEKYGFWGGEIGENETPEQAIKRELAEELGFVPKKLDYWDKFSYIVQEKCEYKDWLINFHVFLSPITAELKKASVREGKGMLEMSFDKVFQGKDFPAGSTKFLEELKTNYEQKRENGVNSGF